jgi:hypothetical protein
MRASAMHLTKIGIAELVFAALWLPAGCGSDAESETKGTPEDAAMDAGSDADSSGSGGSGGSSSGCVPLPVVVSCPAAEPDAAGCPAPPIGYSGDAGPPFPVGCAITNDSRGTPCLGTHCDCKPGDPPFWYCLL